MMGYFFEYCVALYSAVVIAVTIGVIYAVKNFGKSWRRFDGESSIHGGYLVAKVLSVHGVKHIFTLVGGHISPILAAAEKFGIRVLDTRHEASAVFAADAAARLTGKIGVAVVTAGPGLTNTITAIKNAQMAESPVLLIGGAAATILKGRGALQDIDQMSLLRSTCKFCATVKAVKDIVPVMRKAINIALSGVPGPVFLEFPIDVLYPYSLVRRQMFSHHKSNTLKGHLTNWYLEYHLSTLFSPAREPMDLSPLPVVTPLPDPSLVEKAANLLVQSRRPLILVGSQAMLLPESVGNLQNALMRIGVPTYLGGMARGLLGTGCLIQLRHGRGDALKKADLIILAGTICDFRLSYGRALPKNVKIITVNRDYRQATMNAGTFWKPKLTIVGDVASFLMTLSLQLHGYACDEKWITKLKERDALKDMENVAFSEECVGDYLNPLQVLFDLDKVLPDNAILVMDGGDFVGCASYILRPRGPLRWLDPGAFGTLGVGGGFALGAKVVCPDAQVWIIYGDGSCGYSITEFDSFVRHNLPVIALVGNDAGWTQIEREQRPLFGTSVACVLAYTNYHCVAEGYGAEGLLSSPRTILPSRAFLNTKSLYSIGKCILINALIGKTTFRDGSISV